MKCPYCYTDLPDTAKFCYKCKSNLPGSSAETEKRPCPNCGAPLPVTAKECYVCKIKFDLGGTLSPAPIVEKESGTLNGSAGSFQPGYKPYTKLPQSNNTVKAKPTKQSTGGCGAVLLVIVILIAIYAYSQKNKTKDDESSNEPQVTNTTQSAQETSKTTTQADVSPLDKKLASDMKNMSVGDIGKDKNVYYCLAYVKKSNELAYEVASSDYTDENHEILFAFVDIYNNSDEVSEADEYDFSCYVDGTKVERMDADFYVLEDDIKGLHHNYIDSTTSELLLLQYEIPINCSEIKIFYGSSLVWVVDYNSVTDESYSGVKPLMQNVKHKSTPVDSQVLSGNYDMFYDGTEYYTEETYWKDTKYIIFKFTIKAKTTVDIPSGHYMRCYQENYLLDSADYVIDEKFDDHINIFDIDEIQEGMSAKIYIAFEVNNMSPDFMLVYVDDGFGSKGKTSVFFNDEN